MKKREYFCDFIDRKVEKIGTNRIEIYLVSFLIIGSLELGLYEYITRYNSYSGGTILSLCHAALILLMVLLIPMIGIYIGMLVSECHKQKKKKWTKKVSAKHRIALTFLVYFNEKKEVKNDFKKIFKKI